MDKKTKASAFIVPAVFCALLAGFFIAFIALPDTDFSDSENRYLEQMPKLSLTTIFDKSFTADFENYVCDQFPARDTFVGVKSEAEFLIGRRDNNGVFFGKDGYLMPVYDDWNVDEEQLFKNYMYIGNFVTELNHSGIKAAVMPVPTAQAVLSDKLPFLAPSYAQARSFMILENKMFDEGYIDVYSQLLQHKDKYIFYKTDHHWTTDGAYIAYRDFCMHFGLDALRSSKYDIENATESFYGTSYSKCRRFSTKPDSITLYRLKEQLNLTVSINQDGPSYTSMYFNDYLSERDKYSVFFGGNNPLITITTDQSTGRRLLIVKDSFAHCFAPFVVPHYDSTALMDLRYYNGSVSEYIEQNGITDVLVLYGFDSLANETAISKIGS